ncbi:MAG TPA: hypothetical protein VGG72_35950 [Bryobacteraceae bacterium]
MEIWVLSYFSRFAGFGPGCEAPAYETGIPFAGGAKIPALSDSAGMRGPEWIALTGMLPAPRASTDGSGRGRQSG